MANLPEDGGWVEGVRAIEETDPVRFDIYNESLGALASRTAYLSHQAEELGGRVDDLERGGGGGGGSGGSPVVWIEADRNQVYTSRLVDGTMYIIDCHSDARIDIVCEENIPIGTEFHFVCAGDPYNVYFIEGDSPAPYICNVVLSWDNQGISAPILTSWQEGVGVFNYNSSEYPNPVGEWEGTPPTPIQSITITENGSVFITLVEAPVSYVGGYYLTLTDGTDEWHFEQTYSGGSGTTELHLTGPTLSEEVFNNAQMCLQLQYSVQS